MKRAKKKVLKTQYVFPLGNAWAVKWADSNKFTIITISKREAVFFAKTLAKNNESDLIIYNKDGKVSKASQHSGKVKAALKA